MPPCWATSASSSSGPTAASAFVSTTSTLSPVPLGTPNPAPPALCSCLSSGGTLLHYAAANGHHDCVAWLLKRGCKVVPDSGALFIIISFLAQTSARDRMGCSAPSSQHSFWQCASLSSPPYSPAPADVVAALALSPPTLRRLTWPCNYLNMSVRGHPCLRFLIITDGCADSDRLFRQQLQARFSLPSLRFPHAPPPRSRSWLSC